MLQQPDLIVVDVDIGENVFHHGVKDVAGLYQLIDTRATLPRDDILFRLRILTIDMPGDGFIHRDGQYQLLVIRTELHLIDQPFTLFE